MVPLIFLGVRFLINSDCLFEFHHPDHPAIGILVLLELPSQQSVHVFAHVMYKVLAWITVSY